MYGMGGGYGMGGAYGGGMSGGMGGAYGTGNGMMGGGMMGRGGMMSGGQNGMIGRGPNGELVAANGDPHSNGQSDPPQYPQINVATFLKFFTEGLALFQQVALAVMMFGVYRSSATQQPVIPATMGPDGQLVVPPPPAHQPDLLGGAKQRGAAALGALLPARVQARLARGRMQDEWARAAGLPSRRRPERGCVARWGLRLVLGYIVFALYREYSNLSRARLGALGFRRRKQRALPAPPLPAPLLPAPPTAAAGKGQPHAPHPPQAAGASPASPPSPVTGAGAARVETLPSDCEAVDAVESAATENEDGRRRSAGPVDGKW